MKKIILFFFIMWLVLLGLFIFDIGTHEDDKTADKANTEKRILPVEDENTVNNPTHSPSPNTPINDVKEKKLITQKKSNTTNKTTTSTTQSTQNENSEEKVASTQNKNTTNDSQHLTFKGVPIDGTLNEYVAKMKQVGFDYVDTKNGISYLEGDFAGFKKCIISVSTLDSVDKVNTIKVKFPEHDDWASLLADYNLLKSMLTEKYGKPSKCVEKFQGYGSSETDFDKLYKVIMNEYTWYTTYRTPKGDIQLSIENQKVMKCFVRLCYYDKINTATVKQQAIDDL